MFQKNIKALELKNPNLAKSLLNLSIEKAKEKIEVYEAESKDLIITYNQAPLESIYDPIREAKTVWNRTIQKELNKNDIQFVFGLGLGYLFKRAYINSNSRVVLYEPFIEILRFVFEHIDFSNEIADERVYITENYEECLKYIGQKYLPNDKLEVLYLDSYAKLANEKLIKFSSDLLEVCQQRNVDSATIAKMSKARVENFVYNSQKFPESRFFSCLEGKFNNKTALLVSAGPSLLGDIESIKNNRSKFLIICVSRALKTLLKHGIKPDFCVFMDPSYDVALIKGIENEFKDLNLILDSCSYTDAYILPVKSKFIYCSKSNDLVNLIEKAYGKTIKKGDSAGTVSMINYFIAKELGCNKFIFSGLDLALKDNILYCDNSETSLDKNNTSSAKFVEVKDINGNLIKTRADYALFVRQFEELFAKEINDNIYNTSSGAYINGMKYIKLSELIDKLEDQKINMDEIINNAYAENPDDWQQFCNSLLDLCYEDKKVLENIKEKSMLAITATKELLEEIEEEDSVEKLESKIKENIKISSKLISEIVNQNFISHYVQRELLEYININKNSTFMNLEQFKKKFESEVKIFEEAIGICSKLIPALHPSSIKNPPNGAEN